MDGIVLSIVLVLVFVLIGGYFAASELAVVSLRDSQVSRLAVRGKRGARVARLREDQSRFLASVQVGVTLAGFFSAAYGGSTLTGPLAGLLIGWGLPDGLADVLALVVVTAVISYFSLVLGELVPKRIALQRAEAVSLFVAPVLDRIARMFRPVIWLLLQSTNAVVRMLGMDPSAGGEEVTEEELRNLVITNPQLTVEERRVLDDVFGAADRQLSEVMVPRTEVDFLPGDMSLSEAAGYVVGQPHSRYPVIGENADDVIGFIHVRDLLAAAVAQVGPVGAAAAPDGRTVADLARDVAMLPGSMALLPALTQMRTSGAHLAVVVDEYGGTDGIVTLEDLIEELVGDIKDEYDPVVRPAGRAGRAVELDGLLHRDDVRERTGVTLPDGPFETLAGFVQTGLGRVPSVGDSLDALGHRFTVLEMEGRRVSRVGVIPAGQ